MAAVQRKCNGCQKEGDTHFITNFNAVRWLEPGLFAMRGRRHGESFFHWGIVSGLSIRRVTRDVKLTNLQNSPPHPENRFTGQTRRLSS
jgi:hypothetical protein